MGDAYSLVDPGPHITDRGGIRRFLERLDDANLVYAVGILRQYAKTRGMDPRLITIKMDNGSITVIVDGNPLKTIKLGGGDWGEA